MPKFSHYRIISTCLLVVGVSIGAGNLAIPVVAGLTGAWPSLLGAVLSWLLMVGTGLILVRSFVRHKRMGLDITSLYYMELGCWGSRMATLIYVLLFNGLLTAYLTGAGTVLSQLLNRPQNQAWFITCFFLFTLVLLLLGTNLLQKCNAFFICLLAISLIFMISQCALNYDTNRLSHKNWYFLPGALPIIFCAFAYHNIIPKICQILDFDYKRIKTALILGTVFVLLFNTLWIIAVIGALPLEGPGQANLMTAYHKNQPATVPLAKALSSSWMPVIGAFFSLLAITTSYVGCGWALLGFRDDLGDAMKINLKKHLKLGIALLPSFIISIIYPDFFLTALNLVGGIFFLILFGIMPSLMLYAKGGASKKIGLPLLTLFVLFFLLELAHVAGWLLINPEWNHWVLKIPKLIY